MKKHNLSIDEMMTILNKKSGVLGISGVSSDFRDLENASKEGNTRAQLAIDVFIYDVKKYIGAYAAAMGGVDAMVFTAGVGENSASCGPKWSRAWTSWASRWIWKERLPRRKSATSPLLTPPSRSWSSPPTKN